MKSLLFRSGIVFFFIILLQSCTSAIEIEGFSSEDWKADRNGCLNTRAASKPDIIEATDQILGKTEQDVLRLMGRPDKNELKRRQQKFYIYYLEPGPLCESIQASDSASYLSIRFNATGVVNEVFVYE